MLNAKSNARHNSHADPRHFLDAEPRIPACGSSGAWRGCTTSSFAAPPRKLELRSAEGNTNKAATKATRVTADQFHMQPYTSHHDCSCSNSCVTRNGCFCGVAACVRWLNSGRLQANQQTRGIVTPTN